jgi:hypothetical protein
MMMGSLARVAADAVNYNTPPGRRPVGGFPARPAGQWSSVGAVGTREVAIMTVTPDDSWEDRDQTQTEDAGLPEHERDEGRRRAGVTGEDDARRAEDSGTGEQNP